MDMSKLNNAVSQYNRINIESSVEAADPHRLIQMLMQGALEKIAVAKGYMERNDIPNKGNSISWAISIIEGLRASLNKEAGGEIAENLEEMYAYMITRLLQANLNNDLSMLEEVGTLMRNIKSAWDEIPQRLEPVEGEKQDAKKSAGA